MKNLLLALLGTMFLASAAHAAPARCTVKDGGWLTGDKKGKAASPQQCELRNALYAFGGQKFGVSNTDPQVLSASRKGYAAYGERGSLKTNPYAKDVSAFLAAVKKDATRSKSKRRYDVGKLTAGFKALVGYGKVPEDVQFRFDAATGLPVVSSPYRTQYKLSSIEQIKDDDRECLMGIDVTGLALGGKLDTCAKAVASKAPAKSGNKKRGAKSRKSGVSKTARASAPAARKTCAPHSIQQSAQTGGADCS